MGQGLGLGVQGEEFSFPHSGGSRDQQQTKHISMLSHATSYNSAVHGIITTIMADGVMSAVCRTKGYARLASPVSVHPGNYRPSASALSGAPDLLTDHWAAIQENQKDDPAQTTTQCIKKD